MVIIVKKTLYITMTCLMCVVLSVGCTKKDTIAPTLLLSVPSLEIEKGQVFNPTQYAKATDDIDGDLTSTIVVKSNTVDVSKPGTYTVVYEVKDKVNNTSQSSLIVSVKESFTDADNAAVAVIKAFKQVLKDPTSLQIHSLSADKGLSDIANYIIKVDYSARNGFGGLNRETMYVPVKKSGTVDPFSFDDTISSLYAILFDTGIDLDIEKIMKKAN